MLNRENEMHPHCIVEKLIAYVDTVLLHMYDPVASNKCDSLKKLIEWARPL